MSSEARGIEEPLLSSLTNDDPVLGYCWPLSASPGESIDFFVSALNNYILEYIRLTDLDKNGSGTPLISLGEQTGLMQPIPDTAWRDGCGWNLTFRLTVPEDWPSGYYGARLTSTGVSNAPLAFIVFIVKPRDRPHADYLLIAHTLTWNAYNTWGGRSRYWPDYPNTYRLSFLRHNPLSSPILDSGPNNVNNWLLSELWVLKWMQGEGHNVDVITDQDFHFGVPIQDRYASIILNTHPEYWTQEMFDSLRYYLSIGGCLLYLGGNGLFERVQLDDDGRTLVFFDGHTTPNSDRKNYYFRNLNPPQPEREILGVAFLYDNYPSDPKPYAVLLPDHRFFEGTGVTFMSEIGASGISGAASGREMDSSRTADDIPGESVSASINYGGYPGTDRGTHPSNLQVLARGLTEQYHHLPDDEDPREYLEGVHAAEMTYYDTETSGFVFSVGSMTFTGSLVVDTALQRIVNNAMRDSLRVRDERLSLKHILVAKGFLFPISILSLAEDYGFAPPFSVTDLMQRLVQQ
jgi:hypothetical protein